MKVDKPYPKNKMERNCGMFQTDFQIKKQKHDVILQMAPTKTH